MSTSSVVTLASIRLQAQQRADMVNSTFISASEWNQMITNSYKELYDLLIAAYGDDYYVASPHLFTTDGVSQLFSLPSDFYKLLGAEIGVNSSPQNYVTMRLFNFSERNLYSYSNLQSTYGNIPKYHLMGSQIMLRPIPQGGQSVQLWYAPEPTNLQFSILASVTSSSTTLTTLDTSMLSVGMNIIDPTSTSTIPSGTQISSINSATQITLSQAANATTSNLLLQCYSDSATIDGISGWEEYVIVDSALKAKIKEETDISELTASKALMTKRLQDMANNRDASMPATVADVRQDYSYSYGYGMDPWGNS